jgi:serine/threonine-protein kinase
MPDQVFLGKYVVQQEIARGGMGIIFKALDRTLNRLVAIKVIHEHFSGDSSFTDRFMREARAMARLHHENIVTIFSVEEDRGTHLIVMEYFPGMDLRSKIKINKSLPVHESLRIALQVTQALAFAHSQGIIHRDIKPANILVDSRGRVKLTDFGIAAALDEASITSTGQIIGTPEYMSPEQAGGMHVDGRTDLYSLGIVLHEMLVGHTPFHAVPKTAILSKLLDPQYDIPLSFSADIPSGVKAIVEDLLRRDPDYRTPRAPILVSQLKECLASLPHEESDEAPTMIASPPQVARPQTTGVEDISRRIESRTIASRGDDQSPAGTRTQPSVPAVTPSSSRSADHDAPTDILPSSKVRSEEMPAQPTPSPAPRRTIVRATIALVTAAILGTLGWYVWGLDGSGSHVSQTPTPQTLPPVQGVPTQPSEPPARSDDVQAQIQKEQEQLAIDEARVAAKQREAEAIERQEKEQAAKQAKATEEQRKRAEEAARVARQKQEAEQRRFAEEQKRLEKQQEQAAKQAEAAEAQRRKAEAEAQAARDREAAEAKRSREEAELKQLQAERVRLEKEREAAQEQARVAEVQRQKMEEEARQARERHEAEQRQLKAEQERLAKEYAAAAQKAKSQEEERRKAQEEARLERQRLDEEEKKIQADRERLEREKELATQKARVEEERRRKAEEEARVARERFEKEQKQLQADRERAEKEKELATQRAKLEAQEKRKAEEEARAARERLEAEHRRAQAAREQAEKDRREAAAQQARVEEERRKKQTEQQAAEQRDKEQLIAGLPSSGQMNLTGSRQQLRSLLDEFKRAYEGQDLKELERLSEMSSDRLMFVHTMFDNYRTIQVSIQSVSVIDDEASATLRHDRLINNQGGDVTPSPILKSMSIKIRRQGDQWGKIEWK